MSVTCDTSHLPIGPCSLVGRLSSEETSKQSSTARVSSSRDRGENTGNVAHTVSDMAPSELANMSIFDAFELIHATPQSVCWKEFAPSTSTAYQRRGIHPN